MMQRQGYLDGEDQKTLLSFVLYGDPLGYIEPNIYFDQTQNETYSENEIRSLSDQDGFIDTPASISTKMTKDLNELLRGYIPGLENAEIKVRKHKINLHKMVNSAENKDRKLVDGFGGTKLTQIMYQNSILSDKRKHTNYARVTLDNNGKIVKLAVSR